MTNNIAIKVMEDILDVLGNKRRDKKTYKEDLRKYAFEQFPKLVAKIDNNYSNAIDRVANLVYRNLGPRDGITFLIERLENYPARYKGTYKAGWNKHGNRLAEWRTKTKDFKDVEERLLKLVLSELRQRLITHTNSDAGMMNRHSGYFWSEKEADFVRVANEVAEKYKNSAAVVERSAKYLFDDLDKHDRAISLMQDAKERGILYENQELTLVYMLRDRKRWKEVAQLLEPMVVKHPGEMSHRSLLIKALSLSDQKDRRDEMLSETEAFFRKEKLWTEPNLALLAEGVYEAKMYKVAVRLYDELIPMHQRARPNQSAQSGRRGNYDGRANQLSEYYQNLARSYSRLGNTIAAVDAAAAGIVARGQTQSQRAEATFNVIVSYWRL